MLKVVYNRQRAPRPRREKAPGIITYLRFDPEDHVRLKQFAEGHSRSMASIIREAIRNWLERAEEQARDEARA